MKRIWLMILTTVMMLTFPVTASATKADPAVEPLNMELEIDGKVYILSGTLKDITEQGIVVLESENKVLGKAILFPGFWYPASVGETQFSILLSEDRIGDDVYVSGFRINQDSSPYAKLGGIQLGKSTAKDIKKLLGNPEEDDKSSIHYSYKRSYASVTFTFESDKKGAPLKRIEVADTTPFLFGAGVSEAAGKEDKDLPEPKDLQKYQFILDGKLYADDVTVADLMENGWRISTDDVDKEWKPRGTSAVGSWSINMYNGIGFIVPLVYNDSMTDPCTTEKCKVRCIYVEESDGTSIWVENGFTIGATLGDIQRAFDDIEIEKKDGYTNYTVSSKSSRICFSVAHKAAFAVWAYLPVRFD